MPDSFLRTRAWFGNLFLQCPYGGKVSQGSFLRTVMVSGPHSSAYIYPFRVSRSPWIPTAMLSRLHSSAYIYPRRVSRGPWQTRTEETTTGGSEGSEPSGVGPNQRCKRRGAQCSQRKESHNLRLEISKNVLYNYLSTENVFNKSCVHELKFKPMF